MEPKKSQGPSVVTVAGSAVFLCVVLVGAAYFLHDPPPAPDEQASPATPALQAILERCEEGPTQNIVEGRTHTRCTARKHPAFMIELVGEGAKVEAASMLVPMKGSMDQLLERTQFGLELFGAMAGTSPDTFLPKEYTDAIGTRETSLVFEGRLYRTQPIAEVGLMFVVTPADADSAPQN